MYCTRCGNALTEGAAFCRTCGQAVGPRPEAEIPADASQVASPFDAPPDAAPMGVSIPLPASPTLSSALFPYAGFWLRLVAHFIDSAVLSIAFGVIIAIAIASVGWDRIRQARPGLLVDAANFDQLSGMVQTNFQYRGSLNFLAPAIIGAIVSVILASIVVIWLYYASMESSAKQGTVGKMVLGLSVTDLYGRRISFARASGRFFSKFITGMIPLFIGYIMAGITEKKQALHDILASCLVLRKI